MSEGDSKRVPGEGEEELDEIKQPQQPSRQRGGILNHPTVRKLVANREVRTALAVLGLGGVGLATELAFAPPVHADTVACAASAAGDASSVLVDRVGAIQGDRSKQNVDPTNIFAGATPFIYKDNILEPAGDYVGTDGSFFDVLDPKLQQTGKVYPIPDNTFYDMLPNGIASAVGTTAGQMALYQLTPSDIPGQPYTLVKRGETIEGGMISHAGNVLQGYTQQGEADLKRVIRVMKESDIAANANPTGQIPSTTIDIGTTDYVGGVGFGIDTSNEAQAKVLLQAKEAGVDGYYEVTVVDPSDPASWTKQFKPTGFKADNIYADKNGDRYFIGAPFGTGNMSMRVEGSDGAVFKLEGAAYPTGLKQVVVLPSGGLYLVLTNSGIPRIMVRDPANPGQYKIGVSQDFPSVLGPDGQPAPIDGCRAFGKEYEPTVDLCEGVICASGDQCQDSACDAGTGGCVDSNKPDDTHCDDGDKCTQADSCDAGVCVGADVVVCEPIDQCHDAGECDSDTGDCSNPPVIDGTPCDDDDSYTIDDECNDGKCAGTPIDLCLGKSCDDLDPCTADSCEGATGDCSHEITPDADCDDGDPDTDHDKCDATGECVGTPIVQPDPGADVQDEPDAQGEPDVEVIDPDTAGDTAGDTADDTAGDTAGDTAPELDPDGTGDTLFELPPELDGLTPDEVAEFLAELQPDNTQPEVEPDTVKPDVKPDTAHPDKQPSEVVDDASDAVEATVAEFKAEGGEGGGSSGCDVNGKESSPEAASALTLAALMAVLGLRKRRETEKETVRK